MAKNSGISWTDHTFNPWWGCVRVSPGCVNCYAETLSNRYGYDIWGVDKERRFFGEKHWNEPIHWNAQAEKSKKHALVFCASMSDVFEDNPILVEERKKLWTLIESTPWLVWLLLTKRPENVVAMTPTGWKSQGSPRNVWFGASTETQEYYDKRIDEVLSWKRELSARRVWLSVEPQLDSITLRGKRPDWIIVGGESGSGSRLFDVQWARDLLNECRELNIPFFLKQLGGFPNKRHNLEDFPEDLRIQEFPTL